MATQTKNAWMAIYRNATGVEVEIPLVENGNGFLVESETGQLRPYTTVLQDARLGELKHVRTQRIEEPVPLPSSPELDAARAELDERLRKFPSENLPSFLDRQTVLKKAIDRKDNFTSATLAALTKWSNAIDAEIEKLAAARQAAIPEPIFEKEELRRHFRGVRVGSLFVGDLAVPGSAENNFDAEWIGECEECGFRGNVKASTVLKMQIKYLEPHRCGQPCKG